MRIAMVSALVLSTFFYSAGDPLQTSMSGQSELERILRYDMEADDNLSNELATVQHRSIRDLDAIRDFQAFIVRNGWTTNQFIEGLVFAVTNNLTGEGAVDDDCRYVGESAVVLLRQINHPAVTNFFRSINDEPLTGCPSAGVLGMFPYTNLEPSVLSYMRTLCVRTNIYEEAVTSVMTDMFATLETMPPDLKPAATNRVAQYMYFALRHTTRSMRWQDLELSRFIPSYSNSIQRLDAMRHVAATATNVWERDSAEQVVRELSAIPAGQLTDIPWIAY